MISRTRWTVTCDFGDCEKLLSVKTDNWAVVVMTAKNAGWTISDKRGSCSADRCPECSKKETA